MTTTTFEEVVAFAVDIVARSCGPTFTDLDVEQLRTRQAAVLDGVAGTDEAVSLAKWADAVAETLAGISRTLTAYMPAKPGSMRRGVLDRHSDRNTPLGEEAIKVYDIVSEAMGRRYPVAEVAERLGIDLATATRADGWRLSPFYGARMGDKH